jgi:hypothetical protein
VTNIEPNCTTKNELSHMYDWTVGNSDTTYSGGYRDNPYKHFIRRECGDKAGRLELVWNIPGCTNGDDWDSDILAWGDANTVYHFRVEWQYDSGSDSTTFRLYRNGVFIDDKTCSGQYTPGGQSVRIGASNRGPDEGAYVGAIYSNVKVWDLSIPPTEPPVIQEVTPDPDTAWYGHEYTRQLVLLQGSPPPAWCLLQGPPGAQINAASGLVSGWVPSYGQIGQLVTFTAKAANTAGADTESWQVLVKAKGDIDRDGDCDQIDFGLFQACFSGTGVARTSDCGDADLDGNNDVAVADFEKFRECLSGPSVAVEAHCAD